MEAKKRLARLVTSRFHGPAAGAAAEATFVRQFQAREVPADVAEVPVRVPDGGELRLAGLVAQALGVSTSAARRLIQQGAIRIDGERAEDANRVLAWTDGQVLLVQRGRREFRRARILSGKTP
jgi:tyrosyl-tRNA synthetase